MMKIKKMARVLLVLTVLIVVSLFAEVNLAQIFMTIDQNGNPSYSDTPSPNAKKIDLNPSGSVHSNTPATTIMPLTSPSSIISNDESNQKKPYITFNITSPKDQETIQNQPTITVQLAIVPPLQAEDKVILYVDSKAIGAATPSAQFVLNHIDRGVHQIHAVLVDGKNNIIKESNTITIYVHYASQINNALEVTPASVLTVPIVRTRTAT